MPRPGSGEPCTGRAGRLRPAALCHRVLTPKTGPWPVAGLSRARADSRRSPWEIAARHGTARHGPSAITLKRVCFVLSTRAWCFRLPGPPDLLAQHPCEVQRGGPRSRPGVGHLPGPPCPPWGLRLGLAGTVACLSCYFANQESVCCRKAGSSRRAGLGVPVGLEQQVGMRRAA